MIPALRALPADPVSNPGANRILIGFWIVVIVAVACCVPFAGPGWDVKVYKAAIQSLRMGHDPYADAMAVQRVYHSQIDHPAGDPPYSYVYSPITLPLVRIIAKLPLWLSGGSYWAIYAIAVFGQMAFALRFARCDERRFFLYLAPVSAMFPGMLEDGVVLGGNIAYILYPMVLLCAALGWRRDNWRWFYLAVLTASCVKAPLLSLIAIPVLSARRQWIPAGVTAAAGMALFAGQQLIWPSLFRNYLQAVDLQFQYNRDFGCSPAGLLSDILFTHGIPYSPAGLIFYVCYAIPLLALLWHLSRRFLDEEFALTEWIPVLLVGVILLNPRIMEYDVAAVTLLMALIAWRFFERFTSTTRMTIVCMGILILVTNCAAAYSWYVRKLVDGPLVVLVFAAGCWMLLQPVNDEALAMSQLESVEVVAAN